MYMVWENEDSILLQKTDINHNIIVVIELNYQQSDPGYNFHIHWPTVTNIGTHYRNKY